MKFRRWLHDHLLGREEGESIRRLMPRALAWTPEHGRAALEELLRHARGRVPYYREILPEGDIAAGSFTRIPVLTRALIQEHFDRLRSDDSSSRGSFLNSTGGTTGRPLVLLQDRLHKEWMRTAEVWVYEHWLGVDLFRDPKMVLWGAGADVRKSTGSLRKRLRMAAQQTVLVNGHRMSPGDMGRAVAMHNRRRPALVKGYAGVIYRLARFAREHGLRLEPPRAVYATSETLQPEMRACIEEVYGCRVTDVLSNREAGPLAAQCPRGCYHALGFNVRMEVVGGDGAAVAPGAEGRILLTALHNYSMPLIRYDFGDLGVAAGSCDCGVPDPVIASVRGRVFDHFWLPDGTMIHGTYVNMLAFHRRWLREFQFIQHDYDHIEVCVVTSASPPPREVEEIIAGTRAVMGAQCRVDWSEMAEIPRPPSGKLVYTRSKVTPA